MGAVGGTLHPFLAPAQCKRLFAVFALAVAGIVARALAKGGNVVESFAGDRSGAAALEAQRGGLGKLAVSCMSSFLAGAVLVANIGIGNAITTFLVTVFVWEVDAQSAMVTAIVAGGFTSFLPFLVHLLILDDVPIALWVMVLPGVYIGARIAVSAFDV